MTCDKLIEMSEEVQDDIVSLSHNITKKLQPWITQLEVDSELSLSTARELSEYSLVLFFSFCKIFRIKLFQYDVIYYS